MNSPRMWCQMSSYNITEKEDGIDTYNYNIKPKSHCTFNGENKNSNLKSCLFLHEKGY